jgi:ribosomal protein L25 (general stress protein Ctc)
MAYAVMGDLVVAPLLTRVFLPTLSMAWFKIKPQHLDEEVVQAGNRRSA